MNQARSGKKRKIDDDSRDWVGELETKLIQEHNIQPVYSVIRRCHLYTSLRDDQCQVILFMLSTFEII